MDAAMHTWTQIGLVALGSAAGGLLRWGVALGFQRWLGTHFPWATFFINITGSFFLGWLAAILAQRLAQGPDAWISADHLRLLLGVGFAGAYTTFSTFEYETDHLLRQEAWLSSLGYVVGSVALGLAALRLGMRLGHL
jgi:CrcB protein